MARVEPVPPEEFGISRRAKSIRDADYCFHEVQTGPQDDLIAEGYDAEQVNTCRPRPRRLHGRASDPRHVRRKLGLSATRG
jgi:hypothetical protein